VGVVGQSRSRMTWFTATAVVSPLADRDNGCATTGNDAIGGADSHCCCVGARGYEPILWLLVVPKCGNDTAAPGTVPYSQFLTFGICDAKCNAFLLFLTRFLLDLPTRRRENETKCDGSNVQTVSLWRIGLPVSISRSILGCDK
jgi:hypothetical protein